MIVCPNCSKENQDRHKFCLGCGARLPAPAPAGAPAPPRPAGPPPAPPPAPGGYAPPPVPPAPPPAPMAGPPVPPAPPAPPSAPPAPPSAPAAPPAAAAAAPAAAPSGGANKCGSCGTENPAQFKFCGGCGARLDAGPAPNPVEEVGSAQTIFVDQAPPEMRPPSVPAAEKPKGPAAKLVMLGPDGQPIGERVLAPGESLEIGRTGGPPWDEDAYLDPKHGGLEPTEEGILVADHDSLNGIFVKLSGRSELRDGDQFRVGQELLRYEDLPEPMPTDDGTERMGSPNPGYWGRLALLVDPSSASEAYPIQGDGIEIGREEGDITFPADGYVSSRHCRVVGDDNGVYVEDVGSSNGTYMRVRGGTTLPYGSLVLIGQKLFQFERA